MLPSKTLIHLKQQRNELPWDLVLSNAQCHKSVIVFGSNPGKTNQNESIRGFRKRLTRQNIIRNFHNQSEERSEL
jgi:hypothetical protein